MGCDVRPDKTGKKARKGEKTEMRGSLGRVYAPLRDKSGRHDGGETVMGLIFPY